MLLQVATISHVWLKKSLTATVHSLQSAKMETRTIFVSLVMADLTAEVFRVRGALLKLYTSGSAAWY